MHGKNENPVLHKNAAEAALALLSREEVNARLAAIIATSDDAIISKDLNGIIQSWNRGAERLFGYTADEAIGQPVLMLIPPDRFNEEPSIIEKIRRGELIDHYETVRRRKDGTMFDISITVSPIIDGNGVIVGASKIARDITERKRAEALVVEADRRKNEFLATLAHELRNPLAPIQNSLHVMTLSAFDPRTVERLHEIMERQVVHMVRLVDDLLELSRINTGKVDLQIETIPIATVIRNAVETSRPLIEKSKHDLTTSLPQKPLCVRADPVRLAQVISNLLNNAAKYTPPRGRISIAVHRAGDRVEISIRDSGIGLSPESITRVFEMFSQVHADHRQSQGGLGIGLALSKKLVELHQGRIEVKSAGEGLGSEFSVILPIEPEAQEAVAATSDPATNVPAVRVLVIDDNKDAGETLRTLLELLGCEVQTATNGPDGLELIADFQPSLALLDLGMPNMDGFEVARRIRKAMGQDVWLVALTGWGQETDRMRTQEAGFDDHLTKPVDLKTLQAILSRF